MTRSLLQSRSLQFPSMLSIESTNAVIVEYRIVVADIVGCFGGQFGCLIQSTLLLVLEAGLVACSVAALLLVVLEAGLVACFGGFIVPLFTDLVGVICGLLLFGIKEITKLVLVVF